VASAGDHAAVGTPPGDHRTAPQEADMSTVTLDFESLSGGVPNGVFTAYNAILEDGPTPTCAAACQRR
jgi:hypothetical protein